MQAQDGGLKVRRIAGALGAEILNVDLSVPLSPALSEQIRAALIEYQVIFFRDQRLTPDQQAVFGRGFGDPWEHPYIPTKVEGHAEITDISGDEKTRPPTNQWHTDATYVPHPPDGVVLFCVESPPFGGDTMWANTYMAAEALSPAMRELLSGLVAVHDFTMQTPGAFLLSEQGAQKLNERRRLSAPVEHPVLRTHPMTGRKALYVNEMFTSHIQGLAPAESEAILRFLYRHVQTPEFTCRFPWAPGSVAVWDNRCTQHYAIHDYKTFRRMHRLAFNFAAAGRADVA